MTTMIILKLHHPTGHPYWQMDEYEIELPDGKFYDKSLHYKGHGLGHRILVTKEGIYFQHCYCGSGFGKVDATDRFSPVLIVSSLEYDKIEYMGKPLEISQELINNLRENKIQISDELKAKYENNKIKSI